MALLLLLHIWALLWFETDTFCKSHRCAAIITIVTYQGILQFGPPAYLSDFLQSFSYPHTFLIFNYIYLLLLFNGVSLCSFFLILLLLLPELGPEYFTLFPCTTSSGMTIKRPYPCPQSIKVNSLVYIHSYQMNYVHCSLKTQANIVIKLLHWFM